MILLIGWVTLIATGIYGIVLFGRRGSRAEVTVAGIQASSRGRWIVVAAIVSATVAGIVIALMPAYANGDNLIERTGYSRLVLLLLPAVFAALPLLANSKAALSSYCGVAAMLISALGFLLSFLGGVFYAPAAVLVCLAPHVSNPSA